METEQTASATPQESVAAAPNTEAATTTETPPSEGQTATAAAVESPKPEAVDYKALYENLSKDFEQKVQGRAGDISKHATSKLEKKYELERLTRAADDPVLSLEDTQSRKTALEKELATESGTQSKWDSITADVRETAAKNPKWRDDYAAMLEANQQEADKIYVTDPDKYRDWVDEKIEDLRVERRFDKAIKERLPTLVEAGVTDHDNKRMGNYPEMPIGNGGTSDVALLASVKNMSGQEYLANKERIYAAIRRKQE